MTGSRFQRVLRRRKLSSQAKVPRRPSASGRAGTVVGAAARDDQLDPAGPQLAAVLVVVVAAVGDHAVGALARPPTLAGDRADPVDQRQQPGDVVAVGAGVRGQQRPAGGVDD
jgi:hypothetical protein